MSYFRRLLWTSGRRRFLIPVIVIVLVAVAVAGPMLAFLGIRQASTFRDTWILRKYEGSLSENLGLLTALTAELSKSLVEQTAVERSRSRLIKIELLALRTELKTMMGGEPSLSPGSKGLPQEDQRRALDLLAGFAQLDSLTFHALGLRSKERSPGEYCLESEVTGPGDSFTFVPDALVLRNERTLSIANRTKRELLMGRAIVARLKRGLERLQSAPSFGKGLLQQAYFIPSSGFISLISAREDHDQSYYHDRFPPVRSFSDRTYYTATVTAEDGYRETEPYIDVAGGGLVKTSAIYLNFANGVRGIAAIDRRVLDLEWAWDRVTLGSSYPRGFHRGYFVLEDKPRQPADRTRAGIENFAVASIKNNRKQGLGSIHQFESADGGRLVFTVPLGDTAIGTLVFDKRWERGRDALLILIFALSCAAAGALMWLGVRGWSLHRYSKELQRGIISSVHGGLIITDKYDRVAMTNDALTGLLGGRDVRMRPLAEIFSKETRTTYARAKKNEGFQFVGRLRGSEGEPVPVIVSGSRLGVEKERQERVLILVPSDELELRIGRRYLDLFSHALKTPAHSILLLAEVFRRRKNLPKFDEYFSYLEIETARFKNLIDNLLSFSLIDSKPRLRHVNLAKNLRKSTSSARTRAHGKLVLDQNIPESLPALVDANRIVVIVNNLLDNALKYTTDGRVSISAAMLGSDITVSVKDTGGGVQPDDQNHIFKRFFRADEERIRKEEGIGLGLFVSRRFAEQHGGKLEYRDVMNEQDANADKVVGSEFILTIPKVEGTEIASEQENSST